MIDYGHGVQLLPLDSDDNPVIRSWRNHPAIMRWCRQSTVISDAEQARWYEAQSKDPAIQMFGVWKERTIGVAGLTSIDRLNSRAEFSLYIEPKWQGSGFGKAALETLIEHAFLDLNLNLIWGESFKDNPAMGMFEKVGFKREGVRRAFYFKKGQYTDAVLFSILRDEWNSYRMQGN